MILVSVADELKTNHGSFDRKGSRLNIRTSLIESWPVVDAELDETDVPDTAEDYIAVANKYDQLVKALDSMQHLELLDSNVISLQQRLKDRSDEYTDRARELEPGEPDYHDDDSRLEREETIDLKEFFTDL